jgi:hypothetical protein
VQQATNVRALVPGAAAGVAPETALDGEQTMGVELRAGFKRIYESAAARRCANPRSSRAKRQHGDARRLRLPPHEVTYDARRIKPSVERIVTQSIGA